MEPEVWEQEIEAKGREHYVRDMGANGLLLTG
jgi:hypothetical protein